MPQFKANKIIIGLLVVMAICTGTAFTADDTNRLYNIEDASGMFNERGYLKSNSFSQSGNEVINDFNGNLMYTQRLFYMPLSESGLHFDMKIAYNGNVSHTIFGAKSDNNHIVQTPANLPEWILSVNGIGVQTFNFENELISWRNDTSTVEQNSYNDDVACHIEGYHKCYRESRSSSGVYYGVISLLMEDGSVSEYYSAGSEDDGYAYMISGEYNSCSKDDQNRGYLWPLGSGDLYGYFTLYRSDGTQVLYKIYQPTYRVNLNCDYSFPSGRTDYPRILLPIRFSDQMGHEINLTYAYTAEGQTVLGRPFVTTINDVTLSWDSWSPGNTSGFMLSWNYTPLYEIYFADAISWPSAGHGSRGVSWIPTCDANRGLVWWIRDSEQRETKFVYRQYSRTYKNLGFDNVSLRTYRNCDSGQNIKCGRLYQIDPWRIWEIVYPEGGKRFISYYCDPATEWGETDYTGPKDTISLDYNYHEDCLQDLVPKFPCKRSAQFLSIGRDPFFLNIVSSTRQTTGSMSTEVNLDSIDLGWEDEDADSCIDVGDTFWALRRFGLDVTIEPRDERRVKQKYTIYRYYPEKGLFSSSSRDRGWVLKCINTSESEGNHPAGGGIVKSYYWNTNCDGLVCEGTFQLDSLKTSRSGRFSWERYSYLWNGDPTVPTVNNLLRKDVTDAWGLETKTFYNTNYLNLSNPEAAYYNSELTDSVITARVSDGVRIAASRSWYYTPASSLGFAGQMARNTAYMLNSFGEVIDSAAEQSAYVKDSSQPPIFQGSLRLTVSPKLDTAFYFYTLTNQAIPRYKLAHDGSVIAENWGYSFADSGPFWYRCDQRVGGKTLTWYRKIDDRGRLSMVVEPNGYLSEATYDELNRMLNVTLPGGYVPDITPPPMDTAWSVINSYNDIPSQGPIGVTQLIRTERGKPCQESRVWIDQLSRIRRHDVLAASGLRDSVVYTFDFAGRAISSKDEEGYETNSTYDFLDRIVSSRYPDPSQSIDSTYYFVTDAVTTGLAARFVFRNNTILAQRSVDENGHIVNEYYDVRNKLRLKQTFDGQTPLSTYFDYDDLGNLTLVIRPNGDSLKYKYDSFGRLIEESAADYNSSYGFGTYGKITYKYDRNGNLIEREDPSGKFSVPPRKTFYVYDQLDRLTTTGLDILFAGHHFLLTTTRNFYDQSNSELSLGRLSLVYNVDLTNVLDYAERYDYDPRGRIKKQVNYFNARLDSTAQGDTWLYKAVGDSLTISYGYDWADHLTSITYPDGSIVRYDYDVKGNLVAVGGAATGDREKYAAMTYTPRNQIESMRLGEGIQQLDYAYNERGWLESINDGISRTFPPDDVFGQSLYYHEYPEHQPGLDPQFNGNLFGQKISIGGTDRSYVYGYDESDRIKSVFVNEDAIEMFTYDANGNLSFKLKETAQGDATSVYQFLSGTNKLRIVDHSGSALDDTLEYTENGDIKRSSVRRASFYYNPFNELAELTVRNSLGSDTIRYAYSPAGERIYKEYAYLYRASCDQTKGDSASTLCTYSATNQTYYVLGPGGIVLAELSSVAPVAYKSKFIYAGSQRIAMRDQTNNLHYFLNDHLGSTRVVVDSSGLIKDRHYYFAFGDMQNEQTSTNQSYRFTGKPLDKEAGLNLYYYGARYYDPELGRFLAVDPAAGKYPGLSPYAYCANNPLRLVDPDGEDWLDFVAGAAAAYVDDVCGGGTDIREWYEPSDASDYNSGLKTGDVAAIVSGAGEAFTGAATAFGSGVVTVGSGGTSAVATVPVAYAGVGVGLHGLATLAAGIVNLAIAKGGTYNLVDPLTGEKTYTGQTNELDRREGEHARDPEKGKYKFEVDKRSDSKAARRGREQMNYDQYKPPLNKKRPIAADNPRYEEYMREGRNLE